MKNKGFTLAELIGVIVVLGVIAVIAVPIVSQKIEDAKVGSAKASAESLVISAQEYYANIMSEKGKFTDTTLDIRDAITEGDLKLDGDLPTGGYVLIEEDSTVTVYMIVDDYCIVATSKDKETTATQKTPAKDGSIECG